jgi:hypothetical protein
MQRLLVLIPLLLALWGCDVIEAPYLDDEYLAQLPADEACLFDSQAEEAFPDGESIEKMVLLEEMTGHKCGNCPRATEVAYDLYSNQFAGQVIMIGIHAGPLAGYSASDPKYFTNYTTPAGTEIYQTLNSVRAVPFGLIDRSESGTDASRWAAYVQSRLETPPTAGIRISNCYQTGDTSGSTVIDLKYLVSSSNSQFLSLLLVENDIVSYQKDYSAPNGSPDIPDYTHHYLLRGAINGTWGQPVATEAIAVGDRFTFSYSFDLAAELDPANCYVVAMVYDETTGEVGQVAKAPLLAE